jgi:hypothetical protein
MIEKRFRVLEEVPQFRAFALPPAMEQKISQRTAESNTWGQITQPKEKYIWCRVSVISVAHLRARRAGLLNLLGNHTGDVAVAVATQITGAFGGAAGGVVQFLANAPHGCPSTALVRHRCRGVGRGVGQRVNAGGVVEAVSQAGVGAVGESGALVHRARHGGFADRSGGVAALDDVLAVPRLQGCAAAEVRSTRYMRRRRIGARDATRDCGAAAEEHSTRDMWRRRSSALDPLHVLASRWGVNEGTLMRAAPLPCTT